MTLLNKGKVINFFLYLRSRKVSLFFLTFETKGSIFLSEIILTNYVKPFMGTNQVVTNRQELITISLIDVHLGTDFVCWFGCVCEMDVARDRIHSEDMETQLRRAYAC